MIPTVLHVLLASRARHTRVVCTDLSIFSEYPQQAPFFFLDWIAGFNRN